MKLEPEQKELYIMGAPVLTAQVAKDMQLGKNGSYSNEGNVLQHTLYDTVPFPAAIAATQTFFTVPQGATKTLTETNITTASQLPNGQTFLIKELSLAYLLGIAGADVDQNVIVSAIYNIIQNSVFEIKIAGREFDLQKPGSELLPPLVAAALNSAANGAFPQSSFISTGSIKLNATPIPVGQLVTFSGIQRTGSAIVAINTILTAAYSALNTNNAQLQMRFKGILTRAI